MIERRNITIILLVIFIGVFFFSSGSCSKDRYVQIFLPDGFSITAECAVTEAERALGLMYREKIESDQGMLFIFSREGIYSFWMKNMVIPLDILWLDKNKRIVHIAENVPPCRKVPCPSYGPSIPAMYVLELKAGSAKEHGLKLFQRIEFVLSDAI
ncbi:MAG: DUF192 domain-containing protein [Candidatus Aminicenantes bacterium]|nr:DUF192 domain-containing protein [Candidatus Aminicenantes bacterium]